MVPKKDGSSVDSRTMNDHILVYCENKEEYPIRLESSVDTLRDPQLFGKSFLVDKVMFLKFAVFLLGYVVVGTLSKRHVLITTLVFHLLRV